MKKQILIFTAILVLLAGYVYCQVPDKMSYQAIVRDNTGNIITNAAVGMRIQVLQGSEFGAAAYVETQTPTSNANGLISLNIGDGTVVTGDLDNIDWSNGPYFLKTEIDPSGGTSYTITNVAQVLSVPYSRYAHIADSVASVAGTGWSLNGNITTTGNEFIGTLNSQPLHFKVGGQQAGLIEDNINEANTVFGYEALNANTTGGNNTAIGYYALLNNTTAHSNTAIGSWALRSNLTGAANIAIGYYTLKENTEGTGNVACGNTAMANNITGNYNTAIGSSALGSNTSGIFNTAVGHSALGANTTGNELTFMGFEADANADNYSNSGAFGYDATITANNQYRIGNSSVTSIGGQAGWTSLSDGRFKTDIQENVPGLDFIKLLRPVTYYLDTKKLDDYLGVTGRKAGRPEPGAKEEELSQPQLQTGFIAQEVEGAAKKIGFDFNGVDKPQNDKDVYGLRYAEFVVPLVKAVQEQQDVIEQLKSVNDSQQTMIEKLQQEVNNLKK